MIDPSPRPSCGPAATALLLFAVAGCSGDESAGSASLLHTVQREDLRVTVRERAELKARSDTRVVSELEGRNTLMYLIDEGTVVHEGQRVAELDASLIEDKHATQAISVAKADAALKQARKNFEVMEKELLAAERTAQSRLQIARIRLAKFLGQEPGTAAAEGRDPAKVGTNRQMLERLEELISSEGFDQIVTDARPGQLLERMRTLLQSEQAIELEMGELSNQVLTLIDEMSLARADFALAQDTLEHSAQLAEKGYVTRNELARDRISHKRQQSRVTVAWNNLQLLIKFTLHETLITLKQEVDNAQLGLESVQAANEARRVQQAADLTSAEAEHRLEKERLDNWTAQLATAVMRAPADGLVVYGRYDWDEPVYEGMDVRQRQDIVILPDIRTMVAELEVHEAQIDKVRNGQEAKVSIDAFPGRAFSGRVTAVSTLPEPTRRSNQVKVYEVTVELDVDNGDGTIRPGMNATVEVEVGVRRGVLTVPLPALERVDHRHFVWLQTPDGPIAREVELGGSNLTHAEVTAGLVEGAVIHLVRPRGAELPEAEEPTATAPTVGGTTEPPAADDGDSEDVAAQTPDDGDADAAGVGAGEHEGPTGN